MMHLPREAKNMLLQIYFFMYVINRDITELDMSILSANKASDNLYFLPLFFLKYCFCAC